MANLTLAFSNRSPQTKAPGAPRPRLAIVWPNPPSQLRILPAEEQSLAERVIARLIEREHEERDPWLRDDYRIARQIVRICVTDEAVECTPAVLAWYKVLDCHPNFTFERITARRKAVLGEEYSRVFDDAGNLKPQWLDIPDYDPLSELRPCGSNAEHVNVHQRTKWPKAPLRRVVNLTEVRNGNRILYHEEQLECGHTHIEFLGANPGNRRRRCHNCEVRNEDVEQAGSVRRPKESKGNLYEMPAPSRSKEQKPLRILPA